MSSTSQEKPSPLKKSFFSDLFYISFSYLVVVGSTVVVYSAATSEALGECKHDARVNSACFVRGGSALATCADDKNIRFFETEGGVLLVS